MAFPQVIERPANGPNGSTPAEGRPCLPVPSTATSPRKRSPSSPAICARGREGDWCGQARRIHPPSARGREAFGIKREVNLYLRPGHMAVPDVFLYLRRPRSKPAGTGSYVAPRDGAPALVLEILSRSMWRNDVPHADDEERVETQKTFCQACGVAEYLQPDGVYAAVAPDPESKKLLGRF